MADSGDVQLLVEFGLINEEGISKLANLIRGVQSLTGRGGAFSAPAGRGGARRRGRPRKADADAGAAPSAPAAKRGRGGKRTPFSATKEDLQKHRETMTVDQIAKKYGVSRPTVFLRLKKFGLTTPRKGAKKK